MRQHCLTEIVINYGRMGLSLLGSRLIEPFVESLDNLRCCEINRPSFEIAVRGLAQVALFVNMGLYQRPSFENAVRGLVQVACFFNMG